MDPKLIQQWTLISELLDAVLDLPKPEREKWFRELDPRYDEIKPALRELLSNQERLEESSLLTPSGMAVQPLSPDFVGGDGESSGSVSGQLIGAYRLQKEIGRGGMANVWLAERADGTFARQVALKLPHINYARRDLIARFTRERNILASLEHPNIARLYDAGVSENGIPYLAMEYVEGKPISQYAKEKNLSIDARLRLFLQVLDAVQFAHERLVIHRDLKPSNILVSTQGEVRLLDFGIAKLLGQDQMTNETELTQSVGRALTLDYASPEQVRGESLTTASDVYSLGVILYELLTGERPYQLKITTPAQLEQAIVDTDPTVPSARILREANREKRADARRQAKALSGDLDTITMKALQKGTNERYATSAQLALEIKRYLAFEPIHAKPESNWYAFKKFVRRNRLPVMGSAALLASLGAGLVGTVWQANRAERAVLEATKQRDLALKQLTYSQAQNDLNVYLLNDASPGNKPLTLGEMMASAEKVIEKQYNDNPDLYVSLMLTIGHEYQAMGQHAKAKKILSESYERAKLVSDSTLRARAACTWGYMRAITGEAAAGRALLDEGRRLLQISPNEDQAVTCLINLARVERTLGSASAAVGMFEEAVMRSKALGVRSKSGDAKLMIDLAQAYYRTGRYRDSLGTSREAYRRLESMGRGETFAAGIALNQWATALEAMGRPLEARRIHLKDIALGRVGEGKDRVTYENSINVARTQLALHEFREAFDTAGRARDIAARASNHLARVRAEIAMARALCEINEFERASVLLDEAESWMKTGLSADHVLYRSVATHRGMIALSRGDSGTALGYFAQAVDREKTANQRSATYPYNITKRSEAYLALGRAQEAADDAKRALADALDVIGGEGKSAFAGEAYFALGNAQRALGEDGNAGMAYGNAIEHLSETMGTSHRLTLAAAQAKRGSAAQTDQRQAKLQP
jgi:eukaryotic-like serine/threonine-protein kinase